MLLADGFGVDEIVLVAPDKGPYKLRRDQLHVVAVASQVSCHVVGACAGFHHDRASMEIGEELDQLLAAALST